jgi:hypothetical protein
VEDNTTPCSMFDLCARLGTNIDLCEKAGTMKIKRLEDAKRRYGGDATLARLVLLEEDVDRLRACTATIIKLLS